MKTLGCVGWERIPLGAQQKLSKRPLRREGRCVRKGQRTGGLLRVTEAALPLQSKAPRPRAAPQPSQGEGPAGPTGGRRNSPRAFRFVRGMSDP